MKFLLLPLPALIWNVETWLLMLIGAFAGWFILALLTTLLKTMSFMLLWRVHRGMPQELPGQFVVYLRPFRDDTRGVPPAPNIFQRSFEDEWAAAFSPLPVIALKPAEYRPPARAIAWIEVEESEWRAAISALLARAHLVIVFAGTTPNLKWEIEHLVNTVRPEKLVIILRRLVVLGAQDAATLRVTWESPVETRQRYTSLQEAFPHPLPKYRGHAIALHFPRDWAHPVFVHATRGCEPAESLRVALSSVRRNLQVATA